MKTTIVKIDGVNRRLRDDVIGEELRGLIGIHTINLSTSQKQRRDELLRAAWEASRPKTCAEAAAIAFKPGDIVRLRSGGVHMMVVIDECDAVELVYSAFGEIKALNLPPQCLELAPEGSEPDIPF